MLASLRSTFRTSLAVPLASRRAFYASARRCDHFLNADQETFNKAVANKDKVVLVDFYADWCGPCKLISPILERLTSDPKVTSGGGQALDLVTVDVEAQTELAEQYQISSLPTVIAFVDGEPVSQFMGVIPEKGIRRFLATL